MIVFDAEKMRPYRAADLDRLLRFVGECNRAHDAGAIRHPGDVIHFMSNTLRGRDLERHIFLYEESDGLLRALVMLYPGATWYYDLLLDSDLRSAGNDAFETAALVWTGDAAWSASQATGSAPEGAENTEDSAIGVDLTVGDTVRQSILERLGYQPVTTPGMLYTTRSLNEPIPDKLLPDEFSMRPVAGEHEAGLVAEVHNGAFKPKWDAEQYLAVMRTPGFQIDHELVVVAPDGRFAAFTIIWLDPISRTGYFEPVGCHRDFQRRGLTSALMYEGMRRMRAAGMETAIVCYNADNVSGVPLYRSVGFKTRYEITEYRKPMAPA
ncbi:MAG TPA: GNAT family N-acetyltransferase [Ktedonobacterales bacterium]|jgi:ribosomal protein S18 acetylase RimI-like enzyme